MSRRDISLTVNGKDATAPAEPRMTLLDFLRDELHLSGTHMGCEHGVCGACTVIVNGEPIRSCLMLAVQADGQEIVTIEGIAPNDTELHPLQQAFLEEAALQCGICTPGFLVAAKSLLERNPDPTETQIRYWLAGNLCRCGTYTRIVAAIQSAAQNLAQIDCYEVGESAQAAGDRGGAAV